MIISDSSEWRAIPTAPNYYVSGRGDVRTRINATHPERSQWCRIKPYRLKSGHLSLSIKKHHYLVHRLVYQAFCGPLINDMVVCHLDGNPANNHYSNLLQTTQYENMSHKYKHGTSQEGERHPHALYSNETVACVSRAIALAPRSATGRLKKGIPQAIADEYGVTRQLVYDISNHNSWKCVSSKGDRQ